MIFTIAKSPTWPQRLQNTICKHLTAQASRHGNKTLQAAASKPYGNSRLCETAHIALLKLLFCGVKRLVLESKMWRFATR